MRLHSLFFLLMLSGTALAQTDNGLELSAEVTHKFNKKTSLSAGMEVETRNDFKEWDKVSLSIDGAYRIGKHLKVSAGYIHIQKNYPEKINYNEYGELKNWRGSFWGTRHRFNVTATGNIDIGRLNLSLRERWQYTYSMENTVDRYNFLAEDFEEKVVNAKGKNVLRSRLQAEYNIRKCPITPYASAETFNAWSLQKTRLLVGAEWKINKQHAISLYFRHQIIRNDDDDNEPDMNNIGVSYNVKL